MIIPPHDGAGGGTPTPRKDSVASNRIAAAIPRVAYTMMIGTRCGKRWRTIIRLSDTPIAVAATTKSLDSTTSDVLYVMRAVAVHRTRAMTTMTSPRLGPTIATSAIATRRAGKARTTSVVRIRIVSSGIGTLGPRP